MNFNDDLSRVLKYNTEAERQAFEKAIDDNPLEATNHLVYADWLDEHGEPDEAAFRRAMGEWVKMPIPPKAQSLVKSADLSRATHAGGLLGYPEGVDRGKDHYYLGEDFNPQLAYTWNKAHHPLGYWGDITRTISGPYHFSWGNYRDMESAFRKAFMSGRNSQSPPTDSQ